MFGIHFDHSEYKNLLSGLKRAHKIGAKNIQIFVGDNHHTTLSKKDKFDPLEISKVKEFIKLKKIKLFIHGLLSLNFCFPPDSPRFKWGLDNLIHDLKICNQFNCSGVVIHLGSFKTPSIQLTYEECLKNFIKSLKIVLKKVKKSKILIETSVNKPNTIGGTIESLSDIYQSLNTSDKKRIRFCIDTCHIFSAGYPVHKIDGVKRYFQEFDLLIGNSKIELIHLNDSKTGFDSHIDRHESIGKGFIFNKDLGGDPKALEELIKIASKHDIPIVLETNSKYFSSEIKLLKNIYKKINQ